MLKLAVACFVWLAVEASGRQGTHQCKGVDQLPVYVINTDTKPERLEYMRRVWGSNIHRVRGPDNSNFAEMNGIIDLSALENDPDWRRNVPKLTKSSIGEAACAAGHLTAIEQAYNDGHEVVVIMEDDVGSHLCPLWPASIQEMIRQVQVTDPDWNLIRLQWHFPRKQMQRTMKEQIGYIKDAITKASELRADVTNTTYLSYGGSTQDSDTPSSHLIADHLVETWGNWSANDIPLVAKCRKPLWGGGANLWSRRGLATVLEKNKAPESAGHKWNCYKGRCHLENAILAPSGSHCYMSLPSLINVRLVEEGSGVRDGIRRLQHRITHLRATMINAHWLMSLMELAYPGVHDFLPEGDLCVSIDTKCTR